MTRKEEIKQASFEYHSKPYLRAIKDDFVNGAEWADTTAWKPADGDNLPEIDREVIAIIKENDYYKVVFAHRPNPNGDAICFDKGGWNMPNVRYWLDLELPKMEMEKI